MLKKFVSGVGLPSTVGSILASLPAAPGLIFGIPNFFQRKIQCCQYLSYLYLSAGEWTEQSLIVDQTHLVLVSGKLVQQKIQKRFEKNFFQNKKVRRRRKSEIGLKFFIPKFATEIFIKI